jgi:type VI secretion system protein ImpH
MPRGCAPFLKNYFGIETTIEEFIGQWITVPDRYRCRLGQSPDTATVGINAVVGSQVWSCQQKFRIAMGPMNLDDYERMLPGSESFARLKAWVRNYVGDELSWELQLILKAAEVPVVRLGESGRLGWTTWLKNLPFEKDVDDLIVEADVA